MEHSCVNSKISGKDPNLKYGILIQNLPENLKRDAIESLEESIGILPSSVVCVDPSKFGVNVIFDEYKPFYAAITQRALLVQSIMYKMYPMVTDLTVVGAFPYLTISTIKSLMTQIAPVWSVYVENDAQRKPTTNYRVIMLHPEIPDIIKLWPMCNFNSIGNNTSYPIKFFCRLCRQNGHTRYQCNKTIQFLNKKLLETNYAERQKLEEEKRKLEDEKRKLEDEKRELENEKRRNKEKRKIVDEKRRKMEKRAFEDEKRRKKKKRKLEDEKPKLEVEKPKLEKQQRKEETSESDKRKIKKELNSSTEIDSKNSKESNKITFLKLIPPELQTVEKDIRELILKIVKEDSDNVLLAKARQYPYGIDALLQHLYQVVSSNLPKMDSSERNSSERAFIIWIDSMYTKIKELHLQAIFKESNGSLSNLDKSCTIVKEEPFESTDIDSFNYKSDQEDGNFCKTYQRTVIKQENDLEDDNGHVKNICQSTRNGIKEGSDVRPKSNIFSIKNFVKTDIFNPPNKKGRPKKTNVRSNAQDGDEIAESSKTWARTVPQHVHQSVFVNANVSYNPGEKFRAYDGKKMKKMKDGKQLSSSQKDNRIKVIKERCHTEINISTDKLQVKHEKDLSPAAIEATKSDKKPKRIFSPGLSAAIRFSKGVLKPAELKAFLSHVKGTIHARKMAKIYTLNVDGVIEQLQAIVRRHFHRTKISTATNKEMKWINELIARLTTHANCEVCSA